MPAKRALASGSSTEQEAAEVEEVLSSTAANSNSNSTPITPSGKSFLAPLGRLISRTFKSPRPNKKPRLALPDMDDNKGSTPSTSSNSNSNSNSDSLYPSLPQTSLYPALSSSLDHQDQDHLSADDSARHIALLDQSTHLDHSDVSLLPTAHRRQTDDDNELHQELNEGTSSHPPSSIDPSNHQDGQQGSPASAKSVKGKGKETTTKKSRGRRRGSGKKKKSQMDEIDQIFEGKEEEEEKESLGEEQEKEMVKEQFRAHDSSGDLQEQINESKLVRSASSKFLEESAAADASTIGLAPRSEDGDLSVREEEEQEEVVVPAPDPEEDLGLSLTPAIEEEDEVETDQDQEQFKASAEVRVDADEPLGEIEEEDEEILIKESGTQHEHEEKKEPEEKIVLNGIHHLTNASEEEEEQEEQVAIAEEDKENEPPLSKPSSSSFTNGAPIVDLTGSDDEDVEGFSPNRPAAVQADYSHLNNDIASELRGLSLTRTHQAGSIGGFSIAGSFRAPSYVGSSLTGSAFSGKKRVHKKKDPIGSKDHKKKVSEHNHSKISEVQHAWDSYQKLKGWKSHKLNFRDFQGKIALGSKVLKMTTQAAQKASGKFAPVQSEEDSQRFYIDQMLSIEQRSSQSVLPIPQYKLDEYQRLEKENRLRAKRARGVLGRRPLPSNLKTEQEEEVRDIFRRQGKISTMDGAEVARENITRLKPGQWLDDEVINFYGIMILNRANKAEAARQEAKAAGKKWDRSLNAFWRVHYFSSFFFQQLQDKGYEGVRRWAKRFDIFTKDIVLFPINLGQLHWVCAAINLRKKRFEYYDSLGSPNQNAFRLMRQYLVGEAKNKKNADLDLSDWTDYFNPKNPRQENGFDCGVFSSITLEQISRRDPFSTIPDALRWSKEEGKVVGYGIENRDDDDEEEEETGERDWNFSQDDMPFLRKRMAVEIVRQNFLD